MFFNLDFYGFIIKMSVTGRAGGFSHAKVTKKEPPPSDSMFRKRGHSYLDSVPQPQLQPIQVLEVGSVMGVPAFSNSKSWRFTTRAMPALAIIL